MSWISAIHNSFARPKGSNGVTIEGGPIEVSISDLPINVVIDNSLTIDPGQIQSILDALAGPIDVNVVNENALQVELPENAFESVIATLEGMAVAYDPCACLVQSGAEPIEGTSILYADGTTKFIAKDGTVTIDPDPQLLKSSCCKAKPIGFCETCYNDVDGFMFAMSDYTFNFVPKDDPGNITMNVSPLNFECKCGSEKDCFDANVFRIVNKQQFAGNVTFPAGAYRVVIRNDDPTPSSKILINGVEHWFNDAIDISNELNHVNKIQDFVPQLVVTNPDGLTYEYIAYYPSNTQANLTGL